MAAARLKLAFCASFGGRAANNCFLRETLFFSDTHVHKSMWCKVCDAECDLMRGVDGPTGFHYNGSEPHRTAHAPCYTCPAINRVRNKA